MAALNYAGIDMSDCYTAIKNIAKKRVDKVLAYKDKFTEGFSTTLVENEGKTQDEATKLTQDLWQIIEDSARYSFNASHSYCVALDSLYGAWLKAHYPLEFYEVQLTLSEQKGDKDKMNALKAEAEDYFGIKFPPFRFGQNNSLIQADDKNNAINNSISAIKGYSSKIGCILYEVSKKDMRSFVDVLKELDLNGLKTATVQPLIKIDYFQKYGTSKQLLLIQEAWDFLKQGTAKLIRKNSEFIRGEPLKKILGDIIVHHCGDTSSLTSYKVSDKVMDILYDYEHRVLSDNSIDYSLTEKIEYSTKILGYADIVTNVEADRKRLIITDVTPLHGNNGSIWSYRLGTKSVGSGKTARLTVRTNTYNKKPIQVGNIVYAADLYKNPQGYWYLLNYNIEN
jgi:DNA polymerase III alpha subunit